MGSIRIRVDNKALPGVFSERVEPDLFAIYRGDEYLGEVRYCARKRQACTEYGWRPEKAHPNTKLTTKTEAVRRLPRFAESAA